MLLHDNLEDFKDLIYLTSNEYGLNPLIIEKDYWITHSLYQLSKSEYKEIMVFKGGTSLTKCYKDLKRFSEDIDIALLTKDMNKSQIKKTLSKVETIMQVGLVPAKFEEERKSGDYRYTQFSYTSLFSGDLKELHPNIRFELTSFMYPHPYEKKYLGTFIEQYLSDNGMQDFIEEFQLNKFELNVLAIERTVIEKLVSLIRMSYDKDLKELLTKTRHLYDLYMTYPIVENFYNDKKRFKEMINIVKDAEFESRFKDMYPFELKWKDAPLFSIIDFPQIKQAYHNHFGAEFVYGELPNMDLIKDKIQDLHQILIKHNL